MDNISWLDRDQYPFSPQFFRTPAGTMHYLDEGKGDPVIFIHGNPSWSFQFRHVIRDLSMNCRCIAPDHLGFGLSEKPREWSYLPQDHAKNLVLLLDSLNLQNITLVVGDWGGPIGLSYALHHPEKVRNIVITNTWLWPVRHDWYFEVFSRFMGGPPGRFLIYRYNFFAKILMPSMFGTKTRLTPAIHAQYLAPLSLQEDRKGCAVLPREILGSSEWLQGLWEQRDVLADKQMTIAWGMKDIAFRKKELATWVRAFPRARIVRYEDTGHFVSEERPADLTAEIRNLLDGRYLR